MARIRTVMMLALLAASCATSSSVKQQIDPLADRIARLEKQQADAQARLAEQAAKADAREAATSGKLAGLSNDVQALRSELAATGTAAKNAEQAALEARAATARAEAAASKATKSFELQQKKIR